MKPTWTLGVGAAVVVALILLGCSTKQPSPALPQKPSPVVAMADSGGLSLRLTLPARRMRAGSSVVATVVTDNESQQNEIYDNTHVRILNSSGAVVYDSASVPTTGPGRPSASRLPVGEKATHVFAFVVPPPGSYSVEAVINATKRKAVAQFVSASSD